MPLHIKHIWIDGQRNKRGYVKGDYSIYLEESNNTTIARNKFSNSRGGTNIKTMGELDNIPCSKHLIENNLITAYSSSHSGGTWTDGITITCHDTIVQYNEIIDATDVGVVLFSSGNEDASGEGKIQKSKVRYNKILNAGNSAYGGIVADSWDDTDRLGDFSNSAVYNNILWTSDSAHMDIVLSVGNLPWFGNPNLAKGARFYNNTTGSDKVNANIGIAVTGMPNAYVVGNSITPHGGTFTNTTGCQVAEILVYNSPSETIQSPKTQGSSSVINCVHH